MESKISKKFFKLLTGVVMGGAIGSILGLTMAPKKGSETREYLREKSIEMFNGKPMAPAPKPGFFKRTVIKLLRPKK